MVKRFCIGLACSVLLCLTGLAQTPDSTKTKHKAPPLDTTKVAQKPFLKDSTTRSYRFLWEREPRRNMIQWNFLSTFVLTGNFSYERIVSKHIGILVGGYAGKYLVTSRGDTLPYDTDIFATSGYMELKIYPWGRLGRGAYVAPYGSFRFMKLKSPYVTSAPGNTDYTFGYRKAEVYNLAAGGVIGYRFILGNWFLINIYAGAGYNVPRFHLFDDAQVSHFNTRLLFLQNYEVRFGMNLGVAIK